MSHFEDARACVNYPPGNGLHVYGNIGLGVSVPGGPFARDLSRDILAIPAVILRVPGDFLDRRLPLLRRLLPANIQGRLPDHLKR